MVSRNQLVGGVVLLALTLLVGGALALRKQVAAIVGEAENA